MYPFLIPPLRVWLFDFSPWKKTSMSATSGASFIKKNAYICFIKDAEHKKNLNISIPLVTYAHLKFERPAVERIKQQMPSYLNLLCVLWWSWTFPVYEGGVSGCCDVIPEVGSRSWSESALRDRNSDGEGRSAVTLSVISPDNHCLTVALREGRPFSCSRAAVRAVLHSIVNILLIVFINNSGGQFCVTSPCCGRCESEDITFTSRPPLSDQLCSFLFINSSYCNLSDKFMTLYFPF